MYHKKMRGLNTYLSNIILVNALKGLHDEESALESGKRFLASNK
jgi:hypothetical protein